ncbi:MAG TPA: hypothetical protein VHA77_01605 [Xanthobacteraceae bacterium]|jgi:hypothetical protein|nr:hypothetical protein [Xanthobacteraceae bacterium]HVZ19210.1 hypothetical protein [Terriglobales bacterium]
MKHFILLFAAAITCILAALVNVALARMIGLNFFTFKLWFVIPVGAMCVGMLGASGAILAARYFHIQPTIVDAVLMVVAAIATMVLIYYLDYTTFVLSDGRKASDLFDFTSFVDLVLTKAHMRMGRGAGIDTGEVGELGYALAALEFVGFLVGGAATFLIIKGLWRCADCGSYLRKLKSKSTKELTFEEASKLIELFKGGDLEMVQRVMAWTPAHRSFDDKENRALIAFNLFGCPTCKAEVISTHVSAFNGKEWKDVPELTTRRNLTPGLSLRDEFA